MENTKKILFIGPHRIGRNPCQRFRFEQFIPYLEQNGFSVEYSHLLSAADDKVFYQKGRYVQKFLILIKAFFTRLKDVRRANRYAIIFVQREAFFTGTVFFEKRFKKSGAKLIYDFDDALWKLDVSEGNKLFARLKNPNKTAQLIQLADVVIAGNAYLADYARKHNPNVTIIPTTLDTNYHQPSGVKPTQKPLCIGWTGSITTVKHFETIVPVLEQLKAKYGEQITFCLIGDPDYYCSALNLRGIPWKPETEISDLARIDIGIMPLPDDEWAKGKCGFKGLQYMALEIPTVMSPVGVNTEIIQDGENGFLAATNEEWIEKLSRLIENESLRQTLGKAGRQTVIKNYSLESQKERLVGVLNS